jgi:hypothetical protein
MESTSKKQSAVLPNGQMQENLFESNSKEWSKDSGSDNDVNDYALHDVANDDSEQNNDNVRDFICEDISYRHWKHFNFSFQGAVKHAHFQVVFQQRTCSKKC